MFATDKAPCAQVTKKSVVAAAVFHAMMDVAFLVSPQSAVGQGLGGLIIVWAVTALFFPPARTHAPPPADFNDLNFP